MIPLNIENIYQFAQEKRQQYADAAPYPHIAIDDFFDEGFLNEVLAEFPDLSKVGREDRIKFSNVNEKKLAGTGESNFGVKTTQLIHYLNSQPFLEFLQELTDVEQQLISDPYLVGGGFHEIKPGGYLKIHADFNKLEAFDLDRRLNLLVYLNQDWEEAYGGHFELWDPEMTSCKKQVLPKFNRMVIFSTTDFSFHGHPNPLECPPDRSRKSLALYYYSKGRPSSEVTETHTTLFKPRPGQDKDPDSLGEKIVRNLLPPILPKIWHRITGRAT